MKKVMKTILAFIIVLIVVLGLFLVKTDVPLDELEQKYASSSSKFVRMEGMNVHYRIEGKGRPLVLLHGTGSSLHTWDGWVQALSDTFRIIRLDLPAFGLTGPHPNHDYRIATYVKLLHSLLNELEVGKMALAGNSLGGFIAWRYAIQYPDQVDRLILLDASGYPNNDPPPLVFRLAQTPVLNKLLSKISLRALVEKSLHEVYGDDSKVTELLIDRYYELSLRPGNREAFVARANTKMADHFDHLEQLRIPVLLMWGERDLWTPVKYLDRFAQKLAGNVAIEIYPDLGHVPMEEAPARTAADASAFLLTQAISLQTIE